MSVISLDLGYLDADLECATINDSETTSFIHAALLCQKVLGHEGFNTFAFWGKSCILIFL